MRFFHTLVGSFYSARTYATVRAAEGSGLGYSFVLVLLTNLITTVGIVLFLHMALFSSRDGDAPMFDDLVLQVANQIPQMTLHNNVLMVADGKAHTIVLDAHMTKGSLRGEAITIDTTGATTYQNMRTPILFTQKELIYRSKKETKLQPYSELYPDAPPTLVINHALALDIAQRMIDKVHQHLGMIYFIFGIFCCLCVTLVFYIMRVLMVLVLGVIGLGIGSLLKSPLSFAASMRFAAVSYTPVAILNIAAFATGHAPPTWGLILCGSVMLFAAMYTSRQTPLAATE